MAESNENPEVEVPVAEGEESAEAELGPEGPDLSGLTDDGRETLQAALDVLAQYEPQGGVLGDLPQVSIDREHTGPVCTLLKNDPRVGAKMLLCIAAVDLPDSLRMVYFLQSLEPERTLVLKTDLPHDDPVITSLTSVWRAADWYEREAHDLFGVVFEGHPDLSPLLLYDGFDGYPGRKEYPLYEYKEF